MKILYPTEPELRGGIFMYTKDLIEGIGDRAKCVVYPFWAELEKEKDIIHWQHAYGYANDVNSFVKLIGKLDKPYVITLHEIPMWKRSIWEPLIHAPFIVGNKIMADQLIKFGVQKDMVNIIPHGATLWKSYSKEEARSKLSFNTDKKILVQPGFMSYGKGMLEIIEACAEIPEIYLIFAGSIHPNAPKIDENNLIGCMKLAKGYNMENRVKFVGKYLSEDELRLWCSAADYLILNHQYVYGALSCSAMSKRILCAERPIIMSSDDPRLSEYEDKKNCLKVLSTDIEGIRKTLKELMGHENLCLELGRQASYHATNTSWYNVATKHLELYNQCLS